LSAYKDVTVNLNWNTNVISTAVTGATTTMVAAMPAKLDTITLAFATGECGAESWGGVTASALASANIQPLISAGKKYILSTGGAAGQFTCATDTGFSNFIKTYYSANLIGVDFDIEAGQTDAQIADLINRVKVAQVTYPKMRFSFTIATLGSAGSPDLGSAGISVMNAINAAGLKNYLINLMVMDYGSAASTNCVLNSSTGKCDMGASANAAAVSLHTSYGVPYNQIELTPMIGGNDATDEIFSIADVTTMSNFVLQNKLAGVHFWSFDRDKDCAPSYASPTCNTYGKAGTLGFTNAFISALGL